MSKLFNKQEAIDNFIMAIEYRKHNHEANDSNYTKDIVKYQIATKLIELFPDDVQFEMYDIPLNNKQDNFIIGNCGTFCECLVRGLLAKKFPKIIQIRRASKVDINFNGKKYELKTGLCSRWQPTKNQKPVRTLFVNSKGIWVLMGDEVAESVDKNGRLKWNGVYSTTADEYDEAFGERLEALLEVIESL